MESATELLEQAVGATVLGKYHKTDGGWLDTRTGEVHPEIPV